MRRFRISVRQVTMQGVRKTGDHRGAEQRGEPSGKICRRQKQQCTQMAGKDRSEEGSRCPDLNPQRLEKNVIL